MAPPARAAPSKRINHDVTVEGCPRGAVPAWSCGVCQAPDNFGNRAVCRVCGREPPVATQRKQKAAVAAAKAKGTPQPQPQPDPKRMGAGADKPGPWTTKPKPKPVQPRAGGKEDTLAALRKEVQQLRAQVNGKAETAQAPTSPAASSSAEGDKSAEAADKDDYADDIAELQKLVDAMASAKSVIAIAQRAELQASLSQLRDKQRAQWPLGRRITLADRRMADKEQAVQKAAKRHEEAQSAAEAARQAAEEAATKLEEARAALARATSEREQLGELPAPEAKQGPGPGQTGADPSAERKAATMAQVEQWLLEDLGDDEEAKQAWTLVQTKRRAKAEKAAATAAEAAKAETRENQPPSMDVETEPNDDLREMLAQRGITLTPEQKRQMEEADPKRQRKE